MSNVVRAILVLVLLAALVAVLSAIYFVQEYEQVVIVRFGKVVGEPITEPGLYFKIPVIDVARRFEKRFLEWDGKINQVPTREKRFILVDTYARWQITDPLLFYIRLKDEAGAQQRLDGILDGETRDAIARHDLVELVRTSNREPMVDNQQVEVEEEEALEPIEDGRDAIRLEILGNAQERVQELGIEILDVQFKRINYVQEVQETVYDRMIAERQRIAERFRSEGQGEASRIRGDKERELKRIRSEAFRDAQQIIGQADAEATDIYASAYNQSADSRDFYAFLKAMETYQETIDTGTTLVLSTDSELFAYLEDDGGNR